MQNKKSKEQMVRNFKKNKSIYVTALTLLVALSIIVIATSATERAKKKLPEDTTTNPEITTPQPEDSTTPEESTTTSPEDTTTSDSPTTSTPVIDKVPVFALPTDGILTKEHDPDLQVFSPTMQDYRVHLGIDIETDENAPVYAAADGRISQIWEDVMMGHCMAIKHDGDAYTIYKNLGTELPEGIEVGVDVRSGQLIASVGDSAMEEIAQEPHLHFEITVGGLQVDPIEHLGKEAISVLSPNLEETKS